MPGLKPGYGKICAWVPAVSVVFTYSVFSSLLGGVMMKDRSVAW
jgi:hypothetical protein